MTTFLVPKMIEPQVRKWVECIRTSGPTAGGGDNCITDAALAALTTFDGLVALVNTNYNTAPAPRTPNDVFNSRATVEALKYLGPNASPYWGYGVLDDATVAASNTVAALCTNIYTNAGVSTDEQATDTNIQGNKQYFGNVGTLSTL